MEDSGNIKSVFDYMIYLGGGGKKGEDAEDMKGVRPTKMGWQNGLCHRKSLRMTTTYWYYISCRTSIIPTCSANDLQFVSLCSGCGELLGYHSIPDTVKWCHFLLRRRWLWNALLVIKVSLLFHHPTININVSLNDGYTI